MKIEGFDLNWADDFNGAVTICDLQGIIVYMNQKSIELFEKYGGSSLLGSNLMDCHPEPSKSKLAEILKNKTDNMYTIEKNGVKKLIYQTTWKEDGIYKGIVEMSLELKPEMPHFIRT